MPFPGEECAPRWNGEAKQLPGFLRRFEIIAEMVGLTGEERCAQLGRYCQTDEDQAFLESLAGFSKTSGDWERYKKSIWRLFPDVDPEKRYSIKTLNRLVRRTHRRPQFITASEYARYARDFVKQSAKLLQQERISEREQAMLYLRGFPKQSQENIIWRLEITHNDQNTPGLHSFAEIMEAVDFIIRQAQAEGRNEETSDSEDDMDKKNGTRSDDDDLVVSQQEKKQGRRR